MKQRDYKALGVIAAKLMLHVGSIQKPSRYIQVKRLSFIIRYGFNPIGHFQCAEPAQYIFHVYYRFEMS